MAPEKPGTRARTVDRIVIARTVGPEQKKRPSAGIAQHGWGTTDKNPGARGAAADERTSNTVNQTSRKTNATTIRNTPTTLMHATYPSLPSTVDIAPAKVGVQHEHSIHSNAKNRKPR